MGTLERRLDMEDVGHSRRDVTVLKKGDQSRLYLYSHVEFTAMNDKQSMRA